MRHTLLIIGFLGLILGSSFIEKDEPLVASVEANLPVDNISLNQYEGILEEVQHPKREFRSAWITTFSNLDWPSHSKLSTEEQKQEFIQILNQLEKSNINAVIVQVRAAADAFYESDLAPWSQWLTGEQGKAPNPYYDPLKFMLDECHKRNIEFHAWLNPFRGVSHNRFSSVADDHISKQNKEWFFDYGETKYFNPGIPDVQNHIKEIVKEIVSKYDVDGIHFDDYFYPYTIKNQEIPDAQAFKAYGKGFENIHVWRRNNINVLIQEVGNEIKSTKPWVKFGVSPLAIWRNKKQDPTGSETNSGQTSYDNLYCDTKLWLEKGWVDYMAPQLYWSTSNQYANYHHLINWWTSFETEKHLYIGHALYKLDKNQRHSYETAELVNQIKITREKPTVFGSCYFRANAFQLNHQSFIDTLNSGIYKYKALIPPMTWIDSVAPAAPRLNQIIKDSLFIELELGYEEECSDEEKGQYFVVYQYKNENVQLTPENIVTISRNPKIKLPIHDSKKFIITAVDRLHNESRDYLLVDSTL